MTKRATQPPALAIQGDMLGLKTQKKTFTNLDGTSVHKDFIRVEILLPFNASDLAALGTLNALHTLVEFGFSPVQNGTPILDEARKGAGSDKSTGEESGAKGRQLKIAPAPEPEEARVSEDEADGGTD